MSLVSKYEKFVKSLKKGFSGNFPESIDNFKQTKNALFTRVKI